MMERDLRRPAREWREGDRLCCIAAAAVAAVGSVAAAGISAYGANKAANAQKDGAQRAADVQLQMYDTTRGDLMPYNLGGQEAFGEANRLLMGSPSEVQARMEALPGYQFTKEQGLKAVQNSASARGLGISGAALKGAAGFATGLADTTFGAQFNRLMDSARLGEAAAAHTGSAGTAAAQGAGAGYIGAGNAQAAGIAGMANAGAGAFSNLGQLGMMYGMYGGFGGGAPGMGPGYSLSGADPLAGLH